MVESEVKYKFMKYCPYCGLDLLSFYNRYVLKSDLHLDKFDCCPHCSKEIRAYLFEKDEDLIGVKVIDKRQVLPTVFIDQQGPEVSGQDSISTQFLNVRDIKTEFLNVAKIEEAIKESKVEETEQVECCVCKKMFEKDKMKVLFQKYYCSVCYPM